MKSYKKAIVAWNQLLAFSPLLASTKKSENIFWPGCAASKLSPTIILKTYQTLRETMPDIGISTWCCASPTFSVGSEKAKHRRHVKLTTHIEKCGIKTIYTLCPNCLRTLSEKTSAQILPAWPLLAQNAQSAPRESTHFDDNHNGEWILHDPCAARTDVSSHNAARAILSARGVRHAEFTHCGANARCCGRKNMLFLTDPAASAKIRASRLEEAGGLPIVTYCESCVEAFRAAGYKAVNMLEVLFDEPSQRGFMNRVKTAHRKELHA